jgi:RNA polymerase sigma-70 factor (ECF subfamily)
MQCESRQLVSPEEFLQLFLRSERDIFRYVVTLVPNLADAQEIVQETAAALWKKIDQYDRNQPFTAWACRFALLEVRQYAKTRQRWPALLDAEVIQQLVDRREELTQRLDVRRDYLAECVRKLPTEQRRIVERYYYDRMSVEAIALGVGKTKEAIYKTLQRIRRALSDCVERRIRSEGAAS